MGFYKIILGDKYEYLKIRLPSLLHVIKANISYDWQWKILWIEAISNANFNILELEEKINNSDGGVLLKIDEIEELEQNFTQIIDVLIIADTDISKLHRYQTEEDMYQCCKLSLELVDSSYWQVCAKDKNIISALSKEADVSDWIVLENGNESD